MKNLRLAEPASATNHIASSNRRKFLFGLIGLGVGSRLVSATASQVELEPATAVERGLLGSQSGVLDRLVKGTRSPRPNYYPRASVRLGPCFQITREIHFVRTRVALTEELDSPVFSVAMRESSGRIHGSKPSSRAAVLEHLSEVGEALGARVHVAFCAEDGVHLDARQHLGG